MQIPAPISHQVQTSGPKKLTLAGGIQRAHVEDINALHLSDELQTLKTSGLDVVGGDGTGLGSRGNQIILDLDLYSSLKYPCQLSIS